MRRYPIFLILLNHYEDQLEKKEISLSKFCKAIDEIDFAPIEELLIVIKKLGLSVE